MKIQDLLKDQSNRVLLTFGTQTQMSRPGQLESGLENSIEFEEEILDAEVQQNEAIPLSEEEIAIDVASGVGMMSGSGSEGKGEKVLVITALKEQLNKLKGKAVLTEAVSLNPIDPTLLQVDVASLVPKFRVTLVSSASGSKSQDNTKKNRIWRTQKKAKKTELEDHLRTIKSSLNKASVVDSKANSSVIKSMSNVNSNLKCASLFKTVGYIWKPTGRTFTLVGNVCPLTRIATTTIVPPREPIPIVKSTDKPVVTLVVQIILWYLDSGCSKHMTGDRSQLINFVQKFLGTVKFGNDHVAKIMGYGDYQIGNVIISRVYYVEGLGHNLFSVGQFCDSDLEASKTKSWLWHRRLSHLNFGAINHLARQGLVRGLPKLKFEKDHLCSACAMGKSTKKTHKPKSEDTNQEKL
nr:hypothetical protein [Tanacetum cinerariifolium]